MTDTVTVWQCIGCGKIEAPQTCIGVCQDRKVELVYAGDHADALVALEDVTAQRDRLAALVRRIACTTPRPGDAEATLQAFRTQAREQLGHLRAEQAASSSSIVAR
jgi:hypothetical protein